MAKRPVRWTRTAGIQFVEILEYWSKRNKSTRYPKKLIQIITDCTNQIAEYPYLYKKADFKDTRVASLGNYSIFYKIADNEILNYRILGQPSRPEKIVANIKE